MLPFDGQRLQDAEDLTIPQGWFGVPHSMIPPHLLSRFRSQASTSPHRRFADEGGRLREDRRRPWRLIGVELDHNNTQPEDQP